MKLAGADGEWRGGGWWRGSCWRSGNDTELLPSVLRTTAKESQHAAPVLSDVEGATVAGIWHGKLSHAVHTTSLQELVRIYLL